MSMDSSQVSIQAIVFSTWDDGRKHAFSVTHPSVEGQGQNKQEMSGEVTDLKGVRAAPLRGWNRGN